MNQFENSLLFKIISTSCLKTSSRNKKKIVIPNSEFSQKKKPLPRPPSQDDRNSNSSNSGSDTSSSSSSEIASEDFRISSSSSSDIEEHDDQNSDFFFISTLKKVPEYIKTAKDWVSSIDNPYWNSFKGWVSGFDSNWFWGFEHNNTIDIEIKNFQIQNANESEGEVDLADVPIGSPEKLKCPKKYLCCLKNETFKSLHQKDLTIQRSGLYKISEFVNLTSIIVPVIITKNTKLLLFYGVLSSGIMLTKFSVHYFASKCKNSAFLKIGANGFDFILSPMKNIVRNAGLIPSYVIKSLYKRFRGDNLSQRTSQKINVISGTMFSFSGRYLDYLIWDSFFTYSKKIFKNNPDNNPNPPNDGYCKPDNSTVIDSIYSKNTGQPDNVDCTKVVFQPESNIFKAKCWESHPNVFFDFICDNFSCSTQNSTGLGTSSSATPLSAIEDALSQAEGLDYKREFVLQIIKGISELQLKLYDSKKLKVVHTLLEEFLNNQNILQKIKEKPNFSNSEAASFLFHLLYRSTAQEIDPKLNFDRAKNIFLKLLASTNLALTILNDIFSKKSIKRLFTIGHYANPNSIMKFQSEVLTFNSTGNAFNKETLFESSSLVPSNNLFKMLALYIDSYFRRKQISSLPTVENYLNDNCFELCPSCNTVEDLIKSAFTFLKVQQKEAIKVDISLYPDVNATNILSSNAAKSDLHWVQAILSIFWEKGSELTNWVNNQVQKLINVNYPQANRRAFECYYKAMIEVAKNITSDVSKDLPTEMNCEIK